MEEKDKFEVEKLILEAKLEISESRLKYFYIIAGGLLGVCGILIPLFISMTSNLQVKGAIERVDRAIAKIENDFKELVGTQLRKPDIECYFEGKKLENSTLSFDYGKPLYIEIKNTGDAITKDFQAYFYISDVQENDISLSWDWWYKIGKLSDEPTFPDSYQYKSDYMVNLFLNPKEIFKIPFAFATSDGKGNIASVLLKIYYGQPEPKTFPFEIVIRERVVK